MMTFDSDDEVKKVARLYPSAELVLRIGTDDSKSVSQLSKKFGACLSEVPCLFRTARETGVKVIGVSFHVGSGCKDAWAFVEAARNAATVFELGKQYGFDMYLLDIGGGWQGDLTLTPTVSEISKQLVPEIKRLFSANIMVISEPGRWFATRCSTVVTRIIGRKILREESGAIAKVTYFLADGVYGVFIGHWLDEIFLKITIATPEIIASLSHHKTVLCGPSDNNLDVIFGEYSLPLLEVGTWVYFANAGAYSGKSIQTHFGGLPNTVVIHTRGDTYVDCDRPAT